MPNRWIRAAVLAIALPACARSALSRSTEPADPCADDDSTQVDDSTPSDPGSPQTSVGDDDLRQRAEDDQRTIDADNQAAADFVRAENEQVEQTNAAVLQIVTDEAYAPPPPPPPDPPPPMP